TYFHCLTASLAAPASAGGPSTTLTSRTDPSSPIRALRTTDPQICALNAVAGYTGLTLRINTGCDTLPWPEGRGGAGKLMGAEAKTSGAVCPSPASVTGTAE